MKRQLAALLFLFAANTQADELSYSWIDVGYSWNTLEEGDLELETTQIDVDIAIDLGKSAKDLERWYLHLSFADSKADLEFAGVDLGSADGNAYGLLIGSRLPVVRKTVDWYFEVGGLRIDLEDLGDEALVARTGIRGLFGPVEVAGAIGYRDELDFADDTVIYTVTTEFHFNDAFGLGGAVAYDDTTEEEIYRVFLSYHY